MKQGFFSKAVNAIVEGRMRQAQRLVNQYSAVIEDSDRRRR